MLITNDIGEAAAAFLSKKKPAFPKLWFYLFIKIKKLD